MNVIGIGHIYVLVKDNIKTVRNITKMLVAEKDLSHSALPDFVVV